MCSHSENHWIKMFRIHEWVLSCLSLPAVCFHVTETGRVGSCFKMQEVQTACSLRVSFTSPYRFSCKGFIFPFGFDSEASNTLVMANWLSGELSHQHVCSDSGIGRENRSKSPHSLLN